MKRLVVLLACLLVPTVLVLTWVSSAKARLVELSSEAGKQKGTEKVAVATASDAGYCNADLKKILRRVLQSCGLIGREGARGCQPLEAKALATVSGDDFNALFKPMMDRGGIVQFEAGKAELDLDDQGLVEKVFGDQKGASYFFVVARSSTDGDVGFNRELSKSRAESVLTHLTQKFDDPDLGREVGLLWLGEEFAQLEPEFCQWRRSGTGECNATDINRGAFVAWIDCRL